MAGEVVDPPLDKAFFLREVFCWRGGQDPSTEKSESGVGVFAEQFEEVAGDVDGFMGRLPEAEPIWMGLFDDIDGDVGCPVRIERGADVDDSKAVLTFEFSDEGFAAPAERDALSYAQAIVVTYHLAWVMGAHAKAVNPHEDITGGCVFRVVVRVTDLSERSQWRRGVL